MSDIPCRVSAETRQHLEKQAQLDQYARKFDPWNEDLMIEICGGLLAGPMATLLLALEQVEKTQASFGADADKTVSFLVPKIAALRDACVKEMEAL